MNGQIPEWPKGTDCKSAANCFGGSNPPLPISVLMRSVGTVLACMSTFSTITRTFDIASAGVAE